LGCSPGELGRKANVELGRKPQSIEEKKRFAARLPSSERGIGPLTHS